LFRVTFYIPHFALVENIAFFSLSILTFFHEGVNKKGYIRRRRRRRKAGKRKRKRRKNEKRKIYDTKERKMFKE